MKIRLRECLIFISLFVLLLAIGISPIRMQALGTQANLDDLPFERLENPTEVSQLLENFSGLEFKISEFKNGNLTHQTEVKYHLVGKEEIQGVEADKVTLRGKGIDPVDIWFDQGAIIQLEVKGEPIPVQMADMFKERMFQAMFFPFYYVDQINLSALEDKMVTKVSRSREIIGATEVDITKIEVEKLYHVDIAEFEVESGILRIAEFQDFLMVAGYEIKTLGNEEFRFEVERVELR